MKALAGVAVLSFLLLFAAPFQTAAQEMTEAEIAQLEAEVRGDLVRLATDLGNAIMAGDAEAISSLWTSDARLWEPGSHTTAEDFADITDDDFAGVIHAAYDVEVLDIFVHGEVAYVIGEWSEEFHSEGYEPRTDTTICFTRLEREGDAWKFDRDVCTPKDAPTNEG